MILKDAVLETTTTTGVGALNLAGAQLGYNAVRDKFADGEWVCFVIEQRQTDSDGNLTGIDREVVLGKVTYGTPDTLARTHVISSTNSDANVNFGAGTKDVYCAPGSTVFGWNLAGVESRTSSKTLNITHNNLLLLCDASGAAFTQNLPAGSDVFSGYRVGVIKTDSSANAITVDGNTTDTINGATTHSISQQFQSACYVWTGAEWLIYSSHNENLAEIKAFPFSTPPAGYLECDGSAVSRTTYANLFNKLGTTYGNGDGSTTFNIPDYRGEFLRGFDNGAGNDPDAASRTDRGDGTTGDNVGTKQGDALQEHTHGCGVNTAAFSSGPSGRNQATANDSEQTTAAGTTGDFSTETRPRNVNVMYCIKY